MVGFYSRGQIAAILPPWLFVLALAVLPAQAGQVNGENVRMVDYGQGAFVQTGPKQWVEVKKLTGKVVFSFVETARSTAELRLFDASRRVDLDVLLSKMKILFARGGGGFRPLYAIVDISAESRIPGSDVAWDAAPGNEIKPGVAGVASGTACATDADCRNNPCVRGHCV